MLTIVETKDSDKVTSELVDLWPPPKNKHKKLK